MWCGIIARWQLFLKQFRFHDIEIDGVFLESFDGKADGNDGGDRYDQNAETKFWCGDGAKTISHHQSDWRREREIAENLDNQIRLNHEHLHEIKREDHHNNGWADEGRCIAGG